MNDRELYYLTQQYLAGTISPEDRLRLQDWYQVHSEEELDLRIPALDAREDEVALQRRILQKIRAAAEGEPKILVVARPARWFIGRSLAAAVVLLVIITGGAALWLVNSREARVRKSQASRVTAPPTLAPGGNRAILTLSDGSTIVLDSARNGMLGNQGNTRIIKLTSGQVAYRAIISKITTPVEDDTLRYNTITTPRGGEYQVLLPDNSVVWLNSASSLKFPVSFARDSRRVILTGEAYFEISKNARAPFIVQVEGMRVNVLGTHFNVMAYPDEEALRTTVAEGSVKVSMGPEGPLVYPNQQASFPRDGSSFSVSNADLEEVLAWKEGKFRFHKTDIRTIMRQIARWYNVDITYKGELSGIKLYGTMSRQENASQVFELLEQTGRVHFSTEGSHVTVMPATP